jgi:predicted AAA+ superfamily ATPase
MISRTIDETLVELRKRYSVITLTGPRQSGKTTTCRSVFKDLPYINFERPDLRDRFEEDPISYITDLPAGAVFDEFQRVPSVASYVQSIVDEPGFRGTFVLTGSTNLVVRDTVGQSLAGRSAILELLPLSQSELRSGGFDQDTDSLLYSGGYPRIYDRSIEPTRLLSDYVATYVERDLRALTMVRDLTRFQTFLGLCAGRTGSILNLEQLGNEAGVSQPTAREWLSLLEASYIAFRLPPYHANISKRLVKRPKLYFYDVGIASYLLGINDATQLRNHPLRGALFETLIVSEIKKAYLHRGRRAPVSFYRDAKGNEVDVVLSMGSIDLPIEIKSTRTYTAELTKGIDRFRKAVPERTENAPAYVIYDGADSFSLSNVTFLPRNWLDSVVQQSLRN